MEMIEKPIKQLYFKYLLAAFGSALVGAIYILVDMAIIGQYAGPTGTAAIALVLPAWSLICSLGILTGIGGSVLYGNAKGESGTAKANSMYSVTVIATALLAIVVWVFMLLFDRQLLMFMGSEGELLEIGLEYLKPLKVAVPFFVFSQMLAAFLRNDNDPELATFAVVFTSILNMIGDYVFAFTFDLGVFGAALATALCNVLSVGIMLTHFVKKKNTLKLVKPTELFGTMKMIFAIGFSVFFVDIAMGVMTMLYNKQILKLLNNDALSVFGAIATLTTIVQCCSYSIGQAAQPILSANFGAKKMDRVYQVLKYGILTSIAFGAFWALVTMVFPNEVIRIFMDATDSVLAVAPSIMRKYSIGYLFAPFTLFATYYFQSILKDKVSLGISLSRGLIVGAVMLYVLPPVFGADSIWFATPIAEISVALVTVILMKRFTKEYK
ncbi:MAG: polysaccharide biosynthesis C-terminal domain-containing protein [Lachnospiraceae bacterium]|nr:polysaccharide biosynthesis C-terminal domain-containing protein [Lachnospiraceae bacterium]